MKSHLAISQREASHSKRPNKVLHCKKWAGLLILSHYSIFSLRPFENYEPISIWIEDTWFPAQALRPLSYQHSLDQSCFSIRLLFQSWFHFILFHIIFHSSLDKNLCKGWPSITLHYYHLRLMDKVLLKIHLPQIRDLSFGQVIYWWYIGKRTGLNLQILYRKDLPEPIYLQNPRNPFTSFKQISAYPNKYNTTYMRWITILMNNATSIQVWKLSWGLTKSVINLAKNFISQRKSLKTIINTHGVHKHQSLIRERALFSKRTMEDW